MNDLANNICPKCRSVHSSLEDCRDYEMAPKFEDSDFVEAENVETDFERGVREGIARREALAVDVMNYTAVIERENLQLKTRITILKIWMFVILSTSFGIIAALIF